MEARAWWRQAAWLVGTIPLLVVTIATGSHIQHIYRERWGLSPAEIAAAWGVFAICSAAVELICALYDLVFGSVVTGVIIMSWSATTLILWHPPVVLSAIPSWDSPSVVFLTVSLAAHGACHAFLQVKWSSLFPVVFKSELARSSASWLKQLSSTTALLCGMAIVPAVSGSTWESSGNGAMVVVFGTVCFAGCAVFLLPGSSAWPASLPSPLVSFSVPTESASRFSLDLSSDAADLPASSKLSPAAVSSSVAWEAIRSSVSLRSFLASDFFAVIANGMLTGLFPLFCRIVVGTSEEPITLQPVPPLLQGIVPPALFRTMELHIDPDSHIPTLYACFYLCSALAGPLWARMASQMRLAVLWQAETAMYTVCLIGLLAASSFHSTLFCCAAMGCCVSGYMIFPEILLARLADESKRLDPSEKGHTQALVSLRALGRRAGSFVQGSMLAFTLTSLGYVSGVRQEEQPEGVGEGLRLATVWIPVVFFTLSAVALNWYSLEPLPARRPLSDS
jgi:Na+/melibiose symporter-like transporter